MDVHFIIPQNYKFRKKFLGIIDFSTAVFNVVWDVLIYFILKNIEIKFTIKIFIFSAFSFPVLLLSIIGFSNESPFYVAKYVFKYLISQKIYLFRKKNAL